MERSLPAGSTWKKWDLHVHTPASLVHNYGGASESHWEAFFQDLEALPADFKVLGINDYIFVDGYQRVLEAKHKHGRLKNIDLILPVIELRLDKFAGVVKKDDEGKYSQSDWNRVNLHVIFDELDPDLIRQQFLTGLVQSYSLIPDATQLRGKWQALITPASISQLGQMIIEAAPSANRAQYGSPMMEGFNALCVSLDSIRKALDKHDLHDRHLLAVGKTEWENMKWNDQSIAEKRNVINSVDLVFTASTNPAAYAAARRKLKDANVLDRLMDCSDAHAISTASNKDRVGHCYTWVKADATFEGLRHAVAEFEQRVWVGDLPPKRLLVDANRTKYIDRISVSKKPGSAVTEAWFDTDIPLNDDLVAIIGNKGSGKSALADILALAGGTKNFESFSFLNSTRFRDPRAKLASHFVATLRWRDGTTSRRELHENPADSTLERVKYLPQSHLETLCNELAESGSASFDQELRKIIFTHVPEPERLGMASLDDLLEFRVNPIAVERRHLLGRLEKLNTELVNVESRLSPGFRQSLVEQLTQKEKELAALEAAEPLAVADPEIDERGQTNAAVATKRLGELDSALTSVRQQEESVRATRADAIRSLAHTERVIQLINDYARAHDQFVAELAEMITEGGIECDPTSLAVLTTNTTTLDTLVSQFRDVVASQDEILNAEHADGLPKKRQALEEEAATLRNELDEQHRLFLQYREQLNAWQRAKEELIGAPEKRNTIAWFKSELASLDSLPGWRTDKRQERRALTRNLHGLLERTASEYRRLYEPVQRFVLSTEDMDMPLPLAFEVRIVQDSFHEFFLERINRQMKGSFAGVDESTKLLREVLAETDFSDPNQVVAFVDRIDDMLHYDRRAGTENGPELSVPDQLRKTHSVTELYNLLYGLEYLEPRYSLTYAGQEISQLSPGERGLLLLVFYLLVDKEDIPLVIDQPEENLDNQTIYKILVKCIKKAKQRRQVIMVTHNPNLAVVCDAEQIIHASCDKKAKSFSYISGALESAPIKALVIEILEGTTPAFLNRQSKYGLEPKRH